MSKKKNRYSDLGQWTLFDFLAISAEERFFNEGEINEIKETGSNKIIQAEQIVTQPEIQGEDNYAEQTERIAANSSEDPQARNNSIYSQGGVQSERLRDSGSLGNESARRTETAGSKRSDSLGRETFQSTGEGEQSIANSSSDWVESAGNERLGDIGGFGNRYQTSNYRITSSDNLGSGNARVKYADNIAAIKLLNELRSANAEYATEEEKKILVRYVGWGGLPQVFDSANKQWSKEYAELKELLSSDEYQAARRSTQDAHYTSETVIRGIYEALEHMGMGKQEDKPNILEPSAGIGNFMGLVPENFNGQFLAVELDPITAAISKYLYPLATHLNTGFQNCTLRSGFDLAIGNPPFGSQSLFDPDYPELSKLSIHNYFLAKSISLLREGGIGAFVVSRYFLDATDAKARKQIAQNADFLGAIRLPNTAFKQNAMADVTTDLVFFKKNSSPEKNINQDWICTERFGNDNDVSAVFYNSWFAKHPELIIGELSIEGSAHGPQLVCNPKAEQENLAEEIHNRIHLLPANIYTPEEIKNSEEETAHLNQEFIGSNYFQNLKFGAFAIEPGTEKIIFKVSNNYWEQPYDYYPVKNDSMRQRIIGLIGIRDSLRTLLNEEKLEFVSEERLDELRLELNTKYDQFVSKFGLINSQYNRSVLRDDPEHSLLESLEVHYDRGISADVAKKQGIPPRAPSADKAAIFSQRVLKPAIPAKQANSIKDALLISLRESGRIDFTRMSKLLNKNEETIRDELQKEGLIFLNPIDGVWEIRDRYLSGNVRDKLEAAQYAVENSESGEQFNRNVIALREILPADIEAVDIGIRFGSTWVPADIYVQFVSELFENSSRQDIVYLPTIGRWDARISCWNSVKNNNIYGIPEYPANQIIESILKSRPIKIEDIVGHDERGRPIKVINQELTTAANQKAEEICQAFLDWVWQDDARRERLGKIYNERFNTHIAPSYDGSHLDLPNISSEIELRPHQKNAVWRGIQEGTGLFDHVVGAGKTMIAIVTAMESKRMGFINKPMIVVPNHLLYQWKNEFYRLYPNANILVAEKDDLTKENRERLFGRIATGDWDAVIISHSSFKKIDMPWEVQQDILEEQIETIIEAIRVSRENEGSRATIKQLEKQREQMETRLQKLVDAAGAKDKSVDFSDLGIDALFVDESHEFKNLGFETSMNVAGLGDVMGSAKALDLFIKCRYLQREHNGRGVFFLTGTPISNTIAEVYTLQRYLQFDEMERKNIAHFDAWASTFGQISNGWELDATGVNYKLKSRFAKFQNVPELLSMYRTFADVVTKNDLEKQAKEGGNPAYVPPVENGKPYNDIVERSANQSNYMGQIIYRMEHLPKDPSVDNPLKITNDARKAGLDYRLIDPAAEDFKGSKINTAAERIFDIWKETEKEKGTQLVFCDLSTPKGSSSAKPAIIAAKNTDETEDSDETSSPVIDMDEIIAMTSGKFSVYDDLKKKLEAKGIPSHEIAFIHDANTDLRKSKLFENMNSGLCRILIGSTSKMGSGMNVQQRLVAAHHLDAPWRPSDLEQRNGRIIRQGNMFYERDPDNFKVRIFNYATKQTYDARMWQCIEYKAAAIEQFRKGDVLQRVIDDVQSEAANAAEMKAAASGNPLILYQVQLASDLRKLEAMYSEYQRANYRMRDSIKWLSKYQERLAAAELAYKADSNCLKENTRTVTDNGKTKIRLEFITEKGKYGNKDGDAIKERFIRGINEVMRRWDYTFNFGAYRGFHIGIRRDGQGFRLSLTGASKQMVYPENLRYSYEDKSISIGGMFQRIDNYLENGLEKQLEISRKQAEKDKIEYANILATVNKPFPQMDELLLTRENHSIALAELKKMQDDPNYVSTWKPKQIEIIHEEKPQSDTSCRVIEISRQIMREATFEQADLIERTELRPVQS